MLWIPPGFYFRGGDFLNTTGNYQLNQWDGSDRILRTDFNADNAKIDAAIKANATAINAESILRNGAISSLTNQLAKKGNCQIWTTTYVGTGEKGAEHPNSITFPAQPVLFFIVGDGGVGYNVRGANTLWVRPGSAVASCGGSWSGNTYSWYNVYPEYQLNREDIPYTVVALIPQEA